MLWDMMVHADVAPFIIYSNKQNPLDADRSSDVDVGKVSAAKYPPPFKTHQKAHAHVSSKWIDLECA